MESLTPSLRLALVLRDAMERGESVRNGIREFTQQDQSAFSAQLAVWMAQRDSGKALRIMALSSSERYLVRLVDRGLSGEAIVGPLRELEREIIERCESQMDEFVELLPLKTLMPLLLFIFPAYLLLLLGPLVERIVQSLK